MFQNGLRNKDIDLLKVYKQKKEASPYAGALKYLAFPITAAVILLSWFGIVTYQNHALDSDIAAAKAELKQVQKQIAEDPDLEKYQSLQKAMNDVEKYKTLHKDIQSYPQLSQNTFDQILIASDVNTSIVSLSYQRETQIVTLQVESLTSQDTEQFVRRLKKSKTFEAVDYAGYAQSEKTTKTAETNEKATENVNDNTEKDADTKSDSESAAQQLLDLLNKTKETNAQANKQTTTVYSATVLCKLK